MAQTKAEADKTKELAVDVKPVHEPHIGPEAQDVTGFVQQSLHAFQEVNRGLQRLQNDLANLIQKAGLPVGQRATPNHAPWMPQATPHAWPAAFVGGAPHTLQAPYAAIASSFAGNGTATPFASIGAPTAFANPTHGLGAWSQGGLAPRTSQDVKARPSQMRTPACDVVDDGNQFLVQLDLPGVRKEALDILCFENSVTVNAQAEPDLDEGALLVNERGPVTYRRTIQLPTEVQTRNCKATLKNGILVLRLPKKVPTEGPRHLDVAYG